MVEGSKSDEKNPSHFRDIVTETIFGFVFWSLFYAFGPMIWFYPLNELEISGYEVYVVVWLSPILLIIPKFLTFIQNKWILNLLRLIMVACVGSFQAPDTLTRLQILALGNFVGMLQLSATIFSKTNIKRSITFWGLILGYFALLVGRIWFVSVSPAFNDVNANTAVVTVGLIACVDRLLLSGFDGQADDIPPVDPKQTPSSILTGVAFGSLLYATQWLFGEVSVVARWSVTGYPSPGPAPNPWGMVILLSLAIGAILFSDTIVSTSKIWWLLGLIGFLVLFYYRGYLSFGGGVLLALYIMSLWPSMLDQVSCTCPPITLTIAVVVYLVEIFFWVWTVAYNFVPGGVYTREHTDYLIGFVMLSLLVGFHLMKHSIRTYSFATFVNTSMPSKAIRLFLGLIILVGASGFVYRIQPNEYGHQLGEHKQFSAMVWTYHFGYDNRGWPSLERTAKLIEDTGADVVGLLESDASKPFLGHNDLGMWLGERLKMYVDFGPATKDHTWGSLLLSKYPIVESQHLLLPSPEGELAPAVVATVNMSGHLVNFIVVHMGNDRDDLDRKLQAEQLADNLANSKHPVVFLGYVTSAPNSRDYKHLTTVGKAKDIDSTDLERWCEYIFYRKLIRLGYARISHASLSDTEIQMAKFRIPDGDDYVDNDKIVKKPDGIPEHVRFNSRFGEYKDGHSYLPDHLFHMSTPKYFVQA